MAYIENPQDQDQDQTGQNQQLTGGMSGGAPQQAAQQSAAPTQPKGSGRFTNIYKYIGANRPQSQRLAETVVGGVQKQAGGIKSGLQQEQQAFQQSLQPEKQRLAGGSEFIGSTISQAPQAVQDIGKFRAFQQFRTEQGPFQSMQAPQFARSQQEAQSLEQAANAAARSGGKTELLSRTIKSPTYTTGQRSLDQLLLEGTRGARDTFLQGVKQATTGLGAGVKTAQEAGATELLGLKEQAHELGQEANRKLTGEGGAIPSLLTDLDKRILQAREQQGKGFEGLKTNLLQGADLTQQNMDLMGVPREIQNEFAYYYNRLRPKTLKEKVMSGEGLTSRDIELLGFKPEQEAEIQRMYGGNVYGFRTNLQNQIKDMQDAALAARTGSSQIDPTQFLSALSPDLITRANVATPEEFAKYGALAKLADLQDLALRPEQMGMASTALNKLGSFDYAKYLSQVRDKLGPQNQYDASGGNIYYNTAPQEQPDMSLTGMAQGLLSNPLIAPGLAIPMSLLQSTPLAPIANTGLSTVFNTARAAENAARSIISSGFCFGPDTLVMLANGLKKRIKDVQLDDQLIGGRVMAITQARPAFGDCYKYKGIIVTGSHAVFDDGVWRRVANSANAHKIEDERVVYSVTTTDHRLLIEGILFADQAEQDIEMTMEESLYQMNLNADYDEFLLASIR